MKSRNLLIGLLTLMFSAGMSTMIPVVAYGQAALGLNWTSLGPDNYSGRTRALLLSNQDQQYKTLYAGGVSGGLWKSVTNGLTWTQIPTNNVVLNVSCITQSPNGEIYVGTGETFASERFNLFSGFIGQGIYKSTDGNTFTKLASTDPGSFNNPDAEWAFVNKLAAGNNIVYAATNSGLKVSTDGGQNWTIAKSGGIDLNEASTEVDLASDGTVIASVGNKVYLSSTGAADGFSLVSSDVAGENLLPHANLARIEMAFAPSDPNTIYSVLIANGADATYLRGQLVGVYVSKNKGQTWRLVGPGGSTVFNVFGNDANTTHYGEYAASVVVDDSNPDVVYVGGMNVWEGKKIVETGFYQWQQKTAGGISRFHNIVFQPGVDGLAYVSTDQGVYTTNNDFIGLTALNRNYRTSMFYTVGFDDKGRVLGGTQGNGVLFIDGNGNTPEAANKIFFGNVGGMVDMSMINPTAMFYASTGGLLERSADLGVSIANDFVASTITTGNAGVFSTPFAMWESFNNLNSRDSITFIANQNYAAGEVMEIKSKTSAFPFNYTFSEPLTEGDSIKIQDIISSRFFVGVANAVYMSKEVLDFSKEPKWFKIASITGIPSCMAYSKDANYLFVGTQEGKVYRIANIALANDSIRADISSSFVIISTTLIEEYSGRYVTSVSVDPNDPTKVIVTLGNYGNDEFIYLTNNSLDQNPTFTSIQGNLPKMPVYASLFEMNTSNVIIGTDFGVFTTTNLNSNPTWTSENNGMGALPIFAIRQQTVTRPWTATLGNITNTGAIYLASHGNGIFENRQYVGFEPPVAKGNTSNDLFNVYPNPVTDQINFSIECSKPENLMVKIYDLKGNLVLVRNISNLIKGSNRISIDADQLKQGAYLIQLISGYEYKKAKFIVAD
ncbi:MAG TPA: T9SS type A sorting domain-containing protein [Lentimicrobium sp.]|nr:T9SS type A sorting domain-containing protein [Lentimicrobium sp.]